MAKTFTQPFPQNIHNACVNIAVGDTTTTKDVVSAGANDSNILALFLASKDTAVNSIQIFISDGTTDYPLFVFQVPAGAGASASVPPVDCLAGAYLPLQNGKRVIGLKTGWKLRAAAIATVGANVSVIALAEDF